MSIKANVASMTDAIVTLNLPDGQALSVPRESIEGSIAVGQDVRLQVVPVGGEDAGRGAIARDIVNELLG